MKTDQYRPITFGCYVRVKATGQVGHIGAIYRSENTRRRTFGIDWGSEHEYDEIERITPEEFRATPEELRIAKR